MRFCRRRVVTPALTATLVGAVAVLLAAGCANAEPAAAPAASPSAAVVGESTPDATTSPSPTGPSLSDLQPFFDALATDSPDKMAAAADLASPGSNAYAYAIYLTAFTQADRDAGFSAEPTTVTATDDGFKLCPPTPTADNPCAEYTNIQHTDGLISDFDAGGSPLAGRITLGAPEVQPIGSLADAKMIAAYETISGSLAVVFEVTSHADGFWIPGPTYKSTEGRQSQATGISGPSSLAADSLANYGVMFEGAKIGGEVTISGYSDDNYDLPTATFQTVP